jgi:hypothetical protein
MRTFLAAVALALGLVAPATAQDFTVEVTRVGALTGPDAPVDMKAPDICGTDIGTMAEIGGRILLAFGDTFGWQGDRCPRFGPNWRSNVLAFTSDMDPSDGVAIESWYVGDDGKAKAIAEGVHQDAFKGEQTRIPTAMVTVGDTVYLHTMSVHGFATMGGVWLCNNSRFYSSADEGATWKAAPETFGDYKSTFNMLALSAAPGAGNEDGAYVYAVGTPCGRYSGARLARVRAESILDNTAWEYFDGEAWSANRADAVEIIKPGAGEGSLTWNEGLGKWMYTTLNELSAQIELRLADELTGAWSEPIVLATIADNPQAYGAFMTPSWISDDGRTIYFIMSQFGPYNTYVMRAVLSPAAN